MSKIIGVDTSIIDNISGLGAGGGGETHTLTYPSSGTIAFGGLSLVAFPFDWATFFSDIPAYAYQVSTTQFTKITQNSGHILALDSSGNLYHKTIDNYTSTLWGNTVYSDFEVVLTSVARFVLGSQGSTSSWALAIKTDGTLWGVGYNFYGVLGLGNQTSQSSWVQIGSDTDWKDITAADYNCYALKGGATDTYLYATGRNGYGATGQGTTSGYTTSFTRVKSGASTDWSENLNYSAGSFKFGGNQYGCMVINSSGELFMFGRAGQQFPVNLEASISTNSNQTYVIQIGTDTNWQQLITGDSDTVFRKNSGLYTCGNTYGFQGASSSNYDILQYGTDTDWNDFNDSIQHGYGTSQSSARCFEKNSIIKLWGSPSAGAWNSPASNVEGIDATTLYNFPSGSTVGSLSVNVSGGTSTTLILSVSE